jgi:hypothetical protein
MRKIIHLAVGLYPGRWRARYGPEFNALLEDMNPGYGDLLNIVKGALFMRLTRSSMPLTVAAFGFLGIFVAGIVFVATPRRYVSAATIDIEDLDRSAVMPPGVAEVISLVFSDKALTSLIEKNELYPRERRSQSIADLLHRFREDITVRPALNTHKALQVSFTYPDSRKAQDVAADLARGFIEENLVFAQHHLTQHPHDVMRVADPPHLVPAAPKLLKVMGLGFAGGALAGVIIAVRRRRI